MDIQSFITEDNHSGEYLAAVQWLESKIGGEEDAIQAAWVKQYQLLQVFEEKLGVLLFNYTAEVGVDFDMFMTMLWYLMGDVYVNMHGYQRKEIT